MQQKQKPKSAPPPPLPWGERMRRRWRNNIRQMLNRGDLTTLIIVWGMLILPVIALDAADWAEGLMSLIIIAFFSVLFGYILSMSRLSEPVALFISTSYGLMISVATVILFASEGSFITDRISNFVTRINTWVTDVSAGGTGDDNMLFVLFMSILFWFLGYSTTWHIFRIDRVWRAVLPPGLVLITNQFVYMGEHPLEIFLILYVFLTLLLVVRSHVDAREYEWYRNKVRYSHHVRQYFLRVGATLAVAVVLLAWILPTGQEETNKEKFKEFMNSISKISEIWDKLFSQLESQGVANPEYYGGNRLELSGAIQLGDEPVLEIEAPPQRRYYWRSTVFDTYVAPSGFDTNWGWEYSRSVRATKEGDGLELNIGDWQKRELIEQTFRILMPASTLVYGAPQPAVFGLPVRVELDCVTTPGNFECVNEGLQVDAAAIRAIDPIREGNEYTLTSSVSIADAFDLRAASTDYPEWVTNKYLQAGDNVAPRLRAKAAELTASLTNPYDKAKAIESWLRRNVLYNEAIPTPPSGVDPVEWAVFDLQQGYCNYYASAMILMLRSQGIPARMAAGFSQGEYDASTGRYTVLERDAHTWVEVYFPAYGWIEFEPTANENPVDREGDEEVPQQPDATPSPEPTTTPTVPPTNTPAVPPPPSITPTPSPQAANEQANPPTATPTFTPSPSPSPTPPVPQQETQVPSEDNNLLSILFYIFLFLVALIAVITLGVVFLIWWVEHRGLGGLSLVEKGYARLAIYGRWLGVPLPSDHTPEERRRNLIRSVPQGKEPINDLTELYVRQRFAPPEQSLEAANELAGMAWAKARLAFIKRKFQHWFGRA